MRRTALSIGSALLAAALAGCGATQTATPVAAPPSSQSTPSDSATSMPVVRSGDALFTAMVDSMSAKGAAHVTITGHQGDKPTGGSGVVRFASDTFSADLTMAVGGSQMRVVVVPSHFYLRLPPEAGLPAGRPWVDLTAKAAGPVAAALAPLRQSLGQAMDPKVGLGVLAAAGTVTDATSQTLDGVPATRYEISIDLAKAAASSTGAARQSFQALAASGSASFRYVIWVDDESLPLEITTNLTTAAGSVETDATYTEWGAPVVVKAPAPREVASLGDLKG